MPITKKKVSYTLDLEAEFEKNNVPKGQRKALAELVGFALIDEITQYLDRGTTPIKNGTYQKKLSADYKKIKKKQGKKPFADMQLSEDMLNNLKVTATKKDVEIKLTDSTQKKKAFNHNKGDTLPQRQWLPDDDEGEQFKQTIMKRVRGLIEENAD